MKSDKFREPLSVFPANLTAQEQNVFALVLREISKTVGTNEIRVREGKPKIDIPNVFRFSEEQLMDVFGCKRRNIGKTIEPAALRLKRAEVGFSSNGEFDHFNPISRVSYRRGGEFVIETLESVSNDIAREIQNGFSEMDFRLFVSLSSRYSRRILKKLSQWKKMPEKELRFSLKEYRELVGVPEDTYTDYMGVEGANFRKYCIEIPFRDIIEASSGVWQPTDTTKTKRSRKTEEVVSYQSGYELIKTGRKYTGIVFKMKYSPSNTTIDSEAVEAKATEEDIAEFNQMEQMMLAIPTIPSMMSEPYIKKAKELGYKIPEMVQTRIDERK